MEKDMKFYLVSFSASQVYKYEAPASEGLKGVIELEKDLNEYLKGLYPEESFVYYTKPKVTEIPYEDRARFAGYAPLDAAAIAEIKKELKEEISERDAVAELNDNAPFNQVGPDTRIHE